MDIEVRSLLVMDVFTVARMLSKVTKGARVELARVIAGEKPDPTELGLTIFQSLFADAEEDIKSWLADLVGKSKEEFGAMPATTVIDVIEGLANQEDIVDFFGRVSQLVARLEKHG